jgi:hypothetical protein
MKQSSDQELWIQQIRQQLIDMSKRPNVPILDIEWLIRRCEDTINMQGHWRQASLEQLIKDVQDFDSEFPGYINNLPKKA